MKKQLVLSLFGTLACAGAVNAQPYKTVRADELLLSGGGSPIVPLTILAPTLSAPYTLTFPGNDGNANQFLQTDGSGNLIWASIGASSFPLSASLSDAGILLDLTNTGTGAAAQFEISNASSTANALTAITNGTGLAFLANGGVQVTNGNLSLTNTGSAGELRLQEGGGSDYTALKAQDQSGNNITYTLPASNGAAGQFLAIASSPAPTSTAATLQWSSVSGTVSRNNTLVGDGSSGSPLGINLANSNTWTANQTFASPFLITANARIAMTNSDNNARDIRFQEPSGTGSQYIGFRAPNVTSNSNYLFPTSVGSAGQVMTIATSNGNDSASLQWTTPVTGLTLPYSQSDGSASTLFTLTNTGATSGAGAFVIDNAGNPGAALTATTNGTGPAIQASGNLVVTGSSDLQGQIASTTGDLQLADNVDMTGDLDIGSGNFTVAAASGNTNVGGALTVDGATTLVGAIDPQGSISNSAGDVTVDDNLTLADAGELRMNEPSGAGNDYTAFTAQAQANSITYTLPAAGGTAGQVLSIAASPAPSSSSATLEWAAASSGTVSRNNTLVGNGSSGSPLGINLANSNTWTANQTFASPFLITANARIAMTNSDNNARDIRLQEPSGTGSQYIGIRAPSVSNNGNYVWPAAVGSVGQVMTVTGGNGIDSATMGWTTASATVSTDATLNGNGSSGSPLGLDLGNSNTWTAQQTYTGGIESKNGNITITNDDNTAGELRFQEPSSGGGSSVALKAPALSGDVTMTLPSDDGEAGEILVTDGSGNMSWGLGVTTVSVTSGSQGTITIGSSNVVRFTGGTGAFTIDGFTGGVDGRMIYVLNASTHNMTISFNTATTASNGINTLSGANSSTVGEGAAVFIYDATAGRWMLLTIRP